MVWDSKTRAAFLDIVRSGERLTLKAALASVGVSYGAHYTWLRQGEGIGADDLAPRAKTQRQEYARLFRAAEEEGRAARLDQLHTQALKAADEGLPKIQTYRVWQARKDRVKFPEGGEWVPVRQVETVEPSALILKYLHSNMAPGFHSEKLSVSSEGGMTAEDRRRVFRESTEEERSRMLADKPRGDGVRALNDVLGRLGMPPVAS